MYVGWNQGDMVAKRCLATASVFNCKQCIIHCSIKLIDCVVIIGPTKCIGFRTPSHIYMIPIKSIWTISRLSTIISPPCFEQTARLLKCRTSMASTCPRLLGRYTGVRNYIFNGNRALMGFNALLGFTISMASVISLNHKCEISTEHPPG